MILLKSSVENEEVTKPIICQSCKKGRLADIPARSKASLSRKGTLPRDEWKEYLKIKCPLCKAPWTLIYWIENKEF